MCVFLFRSVAAGEDEADPLVPPLFSAMFWLLLLLLLVLLVVGVVPAACVIAVAAYVVHVDGGAPGGCAGSRHSHPPPTLSTLPIPLLPPLLSSDR